MMLLRAAERTAVPWKNGGGVTRDVAVFPPGADMDRFEWRVSIAEVTAAGPFSCFGGVDRVLTVLDGRLALRFDATGETMVLEPGCPFRFAGDVAVTGTPLDGSVRDLNVMVRRDRWQAQVVPGTPHLPTGGTRIAIAGASGSGIAPLDALVLGTTQAFPTGLTGWQIRIDAR